MSVIRTGVKFEAEDDVSGAADKIADSVEGSARRQVDAIEDVDSANDSLLETMGNVANVVTGVANTVQLASDAFNFAREQVMAYVEASLNQRNEGDEQLAQWREMQANLEDLTAQVGEQLIPVILGFYNAMRPLLDAYAAWRQENNDVMAQGLGDFLENTARLLVQGVAGGLKIVIGAWSGTRIAIATVTGAVADFAATIARTVSDVLRRMQQLAGAAGFEGLTKQIAGARETLGGFAEISTGISEQASKDAQEVADGYLETAQAIDQFTVPALKAVGNISEEVHKQTLAEVDKTNQVEKELADARKARAEEEAQRQEELTQQREAALQRQREAERKALEEQMFWINFKAEQEREAREERRAAMEAQRDEAMEVSGQMGAAFGSAFSAIGQGAEEMGEAIKQAGGSTLRVIFDLIRKEVMAEAVKASAKAFAAHQGIPFAGFAIGAAAGAAAFGFVEALLSNIPGFATGGRVPGVGAQMDSVVIRAMPRERLLSPSEEGFLDRVLSGQMQPQPMQAAGGRNLNVTITSMFPFATQTEMDNVVDKRLVPSLRRVERFS